MTTRHHPAHDAVDALLTRPRRRVNVTPDVGYDVSAPCLLAQLADAIGVGREHTTRRATPGSRPPADVDALDLWREILHNVHSWARLLDIDRRPYLDQPKPAQAAPGRAPESEPWWQQLDPQAADIIHDLPTPTTSDRPAPTRNTPPPAGQPSTPPVGRLLRLVTTTAVTRGLDPIAEAIRRNADRWRTQIEQMLHGAHEQRGIRGATCPHCAADTVLDQVADGPDAGWYRTPAIVLTSRTLPEGILSWLVCLACGWTAAPDQYAAELYLARVRSCAVLLWLLHAPRTRQEAPA